MAAATEALEKTSLRKVLVPGLILALGTHPYVTRLETVSQSLYGLGGISVFVGEVIILGLLISSAIRPIYYLYEGFRLPWVTWPARKWNEVTCRRLKAQLGKLYAKAPDGAGSAVAPRDQQEAVLLYEQLRDFPLVPSDEGPTYVVERPTRLGNIIASYELYPDSRYGVDGMGYWYHLLYLAPADARKDFQVNEEFAESFVLGSASGVVLALLGGCLVTGRLVALHFPHWAIVEVPVTTAVGWLHLISGVLIAVFFYEMALPAHRILGQSFRALTDLAMPEFRAWLSKFNPERDPKAEKIERYLDDLEKDDIQKRSRGARKRRR